MKKTKAQKKTLKQPFPSSLVAVGVIMLVIGLAIGYFLPMITTPRLASAKEIETAKNEISAMYKASAVDACWQVNNGEDLGYEKYELNFQSIRINKFANRAIISDCADFSQLLFKDKSNKWHATDVNITLFNRTNPEWQKACQIEDITVADDTVRPENGSIDEHNLEICRKIQEL